jgi:hypothetical protein
LAAKIINGQKKKMYDPKIDFEDLTSHIVEAWRMIAPKK